MWRREMGMKREKEVKERARAKGFMRMELIATIPSERRQAKTHKVETQTWWWWRGQWVVVINPSMVDEPLLRSESEN
jgi:hypothetical protein